MNKGTNAELRVGEVRQQSALCDADRRVVLVTKDPELAQLIGSLCLKSCYPDTTDEHGNWNGTFKIEVARSR